MCKYLLFPFALAFGTCAGAHSHADILAFCRGLLIPATPYGYDGPARPAPTMPEILVSHLAKAVSELGSQQPESPLLAEHFLPRKGDVLLRHEGDRAYGLFSFLKPFQRWSGLGNLIEWDEHIHGEFQESPFYTSVLNIFWGRPRNLRSTDFLRLALIHRADSKDYRFSLVLGPFLKEQAIGLTSQLNDFFTDRPRGYSIEQIRGENDRAVFLSIKNALLNKANSDFLRDLIHRLQDLHLQ